MTDQPANHAQERVPRDYSESELDQEPGLLDAFRFLYQRRIKLVVYFLAILSIGMIAFLIWYFTAARSVEGTIGLNFQGIEKAQYPSGKRFTVEDFRSPEILSKSLAISGIPVDRVQIQDLAAHVNVTPVIPAEIQNRWRKADKDATKKEEYYPNEFKIGIDMPGLSTTHLFRLFDAVVQCFQERTKKEQKKALYFVASWDSSYEKLASKYDFWDIPELFRESYSLLNEHLDSLILEATKYQDPRFQLAFRELSKELDTWSKTRLQALEALTYQGQLVRNRDLVMQRIQYRIQDLEIGIQQKNQEAAEAIRLLEVIDRPKALLAGQLSNREGLPIVDANALDRLVRSDYVGPVVERISDIQEEVQEMQVDKARLQKQLSWLPKLSNTTQIPQVHRELLTTLSAELDLIIKNYNQTYDEYLTATITSLCAIVQSPILVRANYSAKLVLAGIIFLSLLLPLVFVGIERLFEGTRNPHS